MIENLNQKKLKDSFLKIETLYKERKFDELLNHTKSHLLDFPNDLNAMNAKALAYKGLNRFEDAKKSFLKIISINSNLDFIHTNLGNILYDLGNVKEAIKSYDNALKINSKNYSALLGLGLTYSNEGKDNQSIYFYKKILENNPNDPDVNFNIATSYRKREEYDLAAFHYSKSNRPLSKSFLLECIYLNKSSNMNDFNKIIDELIISNKLNPLAACLSSHASIAFSQKDKYPFCKEPFNFIDKNNLFLEKDFNNELISQILLDINSSNITKKAQSLLKNGLQSSGNLFNLEHESIKKLKMIIEIKIQEYREKFKYSNDGFISKWPKDYNLWGWIITINKGGKLLPHMHKEGWLSSSIYLKRPKKISTNDGDIRFSFHGANYPKNNKEFENKVIPIVEGDMVMFPSSLFHSTIPFESNEERITLAFDVIPKNI